MAKKNRNDNDLHHKTNSPNPRPLQRTRPTTTAEDPVEIDLQLSPQRLDNTFSSLTVNPTDATVNTAVNDGPSAPAPATTANPTFSPAVINMTFINGPISKPNAYYWNHHVASATAMTASELFGEESTTFHQLNRHTKARANLAPRDQLSVARYTTVFQRVFAEKPIDADKVSSPDLKLLASRLALADPIALFQGEAYWSQTRQLLVGDLACAWVASYNLFGAPWNSKEPRDVFLPSVPSEEPKTVSGSEPSASASKPPAPPSITRKSTSFGTLPPPLLSNPYKITKSLRTMSSKDKDVKTRLKVSSITFLTLFLPRLRAKGGKDQSAEITALLEIFMAHILKADSKASWLPWLDSEIVRNPPITKSRLAIPSSKAALLDYTEKGAFTQEGKSPILRLRLGHCCALDTLSSEALTNKLGSNNISIRVCPIQADEEHLLGSMLGSHPDVFVEANWLEAHSLVPALAGGNLEFRLGTFDTDPTQQEWTNKRADPSPRVVQIWSSLPRARPLRNALLALYSSKNTASSLPMGHRMRFIPNIMSDRFISSADERRMAKKARSKQTRFLSTMVPFSNYQIVGLRFPLEAYGGITLHEALSGLRSRQDPSSALFCTMEDLGNKVVFLFHQDRADEAMPMIPALPRVMEALIGPNIWPWFDDSAKADCEGYAFDLKRGVYSTDPMFDADFEEWSDADSYDDEQPTSSDAAFSLQLGSTGAGQWDDSSMKTAKPSAEVTEDESAPPEHIFPNSS